MSPTTAAVMIFSILFPSKGWYAPTQPMDLRVQSDRAMTLTLTDFTGKPLDATGNSDVQPNQTVDLRKIFSEVNQPGTYVLFAVPKGSDVTKFVGTPLVVDVREDTRREAQTGPMVVRVEPLRYATISTDK